MKKQYRFLICALLLAGSVQAKTPTCGSSQATDLLARSLAANLKDMGVNANGLEKQIRINDIQILKRDERLDRYSCQANFSVNKPAGVSDKIYKLFAQQKKRDEAFDKLHDAMSAKYGIAGHNLVSKLLFVLTNGMGLKFGDLGGTPQQLASALPALKAVLDEITSPFPTPVVYQLFQTQTDGRMRNAVNWQTDSDVLLELNAVLFLMDEALK